MIRNYFKIAWRTLLKNKIASIITISGLTLGITACLIIYLDASFELSFDNFQSDKERIYRVVTTFTQSTGSKSFSASVPLPMAETIRKEFTGVENTAQFFSYYAKITIPTKGGAPKKLDIKNDMEEPSDIVIADPEYFDILEYEWIAGNAASMKKPFQVVLTETKAKKYFGSMQLDKIIGKEIIYNDSLRMFVSGIVKEYPKNSDFQFNDFISSPTVKYSFLKTKMNFTNWQGWYNSSQTFIKTTKGAAITQFEKQAMVLVKKNMDIGNGATVSISLQPFTDIHFNTDYKADYGRQVHLPTLYGLMGIAIFILLIAAINFINLSTAQSIQRSKEIGIRKVLGGSKTSLTLQFLTETFLITLCSLVLSLLIAPSVIKAFHSFLPDGIALTYTFPVLVFIFFTTIITSMLAGLYPAKVLSSYIPIISLKGGKIQQGKGKIYLRKTLIIFQFTISLVFIIATLIVGKQVRYALNTDMGFTKDAIITIRTSRNYPPDKKELLAQQIKNVAGVEMVSVGLGNPAEKKHWSTILKYKEMGEEPIGSQFLAGDENYIQLYQLKLLAGRNLISSDTMREYLINETCARKLGFKKPEDAIGKKISAGMNDATTSHKEMPIVGILQDFHSQSLHEAIEPTFISTSKKFSIVLSVKLATQGRKVDDFKETLNNVEKVWKNIYPNEKFEYNFFDETIAKFYEKELKTGQLMNIAMAISIFISCMGLFGLATFAAIQRTKEIGIRKVLGANVMTIVSMLSADFLKLVVISIIIASPIAYYFMHQWLQDFAYRINISWWIFALAGSMAIIIALVTISFQAIKAAMANPVKSLRAE